MSKAITEKQDEHGPGKRWEPTVETAPSVVREDEPTVARTFGLIGASFVIFGGIALILNVTGQTERVGILFSSIILALGVVSVLSHAAYDRDLQIRRLYWGLGLGLIALGVFLCIIPFDGAVGGLSGAGFPAIGVALLFLLAALHHETDPGIQQLTRMILLGVGGAGAGAALVVSNFADTAYLIPYGALAGVLGLAYLTAYVSQAGLADDNGYRAALGMGTAGLAAIVIGLFRIEAGVGRLIFLVLIGAGIAGYMWSVKKEQPGTTVPLAGSSLAVLVLALIRFLIGGQARGMEMPLVPWGLMYIALGLLYLCVSVAILSDRPVVVLMRRELSAFFFSPLIYLILLAMAFIAWFFYRGFLGVLVQVPVPEPIIAHYFLDWGPIFIVTFVVPVLTMKLLSEEKRTGSLEVLLTAPVNETSVVVGKFLAALLLFVIMWTPWLFFLVALRLGGGVPFDYRPLFSFLIVLALTGAGFISMGLFFSSLTKNQVASAVLTFAGMVLYFGIFLLQRNMQRDGAGTGWLKVVEHISYVGLWLRSIDGILVPKFLLFHASITVFWLFLTVKVLEARRWA